MLTHGHEDHIGAVPYLLREKPDIPMVGSRLTLALVEAKLRSTASSPTRSRSPRGAPRAFGPFECEFLAVNHSIPDALAVAIRTPAGARAAHRRLQDGPAAPRRAAHRPARFRPARRGGRRPVHGRLDQRRGAGLHRARARHRAGHRPGVRGRRRAASSSRRFASHVHRVQQVLDVAAAHGARWRSSAARWSATWASPATSATSTSPAARWSTSRASTICPTTRSC